MSFYQEIKPQLSVVKCSEHLTGQISEGHTLFQALRAIFPEPPLVRCAVAMDRVPHGCRGHEIGLRSSRALLLRARHTPNAAAVAEELAGHQQRLPQHDEAKEDQRAAAPEPARKPFNAHVACFLPGLRHKSEAQGLWKIRKLLKPGCSSQHAIAHRAMATRSGSP